MVSFLVALACLALIVAHGYGRTAAGERREGLLARHLGTESYWPWVAPGFGVFALLVGALVFAVSLEPSSGASDDGCLDVCVLTGDGIVALLRFVVFFAAAVGAVVGALAVLKDGARVVGVVGLALAALAAFLAAVAG